MTKCKCKCKKSQNYDLAKYVARLESNRTALGGVLKRKLEQHHLLQQRAAEKCLSKEWQTISLEMCATLVSSTPRRVECVVIINKGGHTKYYKIKDSNLGNEWFTCVYLFIF